MSPADHAARLDACARGSRFHSLALVLDLEDDEAPGLLRTVRSAEALGAVRAARAARHRYVVLAGQLLRKKAGCFAVTAAHAEVLPLAALAAAARMGEAGESLSIWLVLTDEGPRAAVMDALAALQGTEGNA